MTARKRIALACYEEFRRLIRFSGKGLAVPETRISVRLGTTKKKHLALLHSSQCSAFSDLYVKCLEGYQDLLAELRDYRALDLPQKEWHVADKMPGTKEFGEVCYALQSWRKVIVGGAYLGKEFSELSQIGLSILRAGWVPLAWVGKFPEGYLTIFPIPGRSAPVPKEWLVSAAEAKQARPVLAKAIARSSFPTPRVVAAPLSNWDKLVALPPAKALSAALTPLVSGGGKAGVEVVKKLSALALSVNKGGTKARPVLTLTMRARSGQPVTLSCLPPWEGSLEGLSVPVAQVLRHYNGMTLSVGAPNPRWLVYRGPASGCAFDWSAWEINDRETDPSAWKRKPLAPFNNGSDLWVYHPARKHGDFLELVKLDHESDTWEAEPQQHPGVRFLQIVHGWLN